MPSGVYERTDWHRQVLSKAQKGRKFSKEHRKNMGLAQAGEKNHQWKGGKVEKECKHCSKIFMALPSEIRRSRGQYCSLSCAYSGEERKSKLRQHSLKQWQDEEFKLSHMGANNSMWRGGRTPESRLYYNSCVHRKWREKTLIRDGFKCLLCGDPLADIGHHLLSAYYYPEFRFEPDNGITYCRECHDIVHILGNQFNVVPTIN
ncbi:MAG: hypothetical protein V3V81_08170 [Candidatus Bathyarchaeia archaeon]